MTLLLNNDDVRKLLTMQMTIDALDRSYQGTTTGETVCRPRIDIEIATRNPEQTYRWGTMEGGSSAMGYFAIRMKSDIIYYTEYEGVKTEEKFASRPGLFCGLVMLFDVQNAEPLAIINEGYLQHFRVGADAGIGARHMARDDAHIIGMFGSGGMARSHVEAMRQVRSIDRLQVFSPTREHREAYAREMAEKFDIEGARDAYHRHREPFRSRGLRADRCVAAPRHGARPGRAAAVGHRAWQRHLRRGPGSEGYRTDNQGAPHRGPVQAGRLARGPARRPRGRSDVARTDHALDPRQLTGGAVFRGRGSSVRGRPSGLGSRAAAE